MGLIFRSDFHDQFGTWPIAYIPYGGADFGEVQAVAQAVADGDDTAYYDAWMSAGDRFAEEGADASSHGRRPSACDLWLRASCFYATSYHPLYGEPVDPRLRTALTKQTDAFNEGLALLDAPARAMQIPFESGSMPGYFLPAMSAPSEIRPLLILTNGYDGNITDMYFASAVAASRRGYHCLLFDGPGQGAMLIERGVRLRPDWESVVKAVVDVALTMPLVDPARIALSGWSLGGYLALRGASGERRLAACVADPALWSMAEGFRALAVKFGATAQAAQNLGALDQPIVDRMWHLITSDRRLRWAVVQRGFWVHGVDNLRDYLASAELFTMDGRADLIRCPTLLTQGEGDPLGAGAPAVRDALTAPTTLVEFTAAEGASGHCEMTNRSALNRRVLDWLDAVLRNNLENPV